MSLRSVIDLFWTHCTVGIHKMSLLTSSSLQLGQNLTHSLLLFLGALTESRSTGEGVRLNPVTVREIALLSLVELLDLVLSQAVFRVSIVIRLLSLISHTTIVTAVVILLLHRLIVAVDCRDHLVQYVLLTL